MAKANSTRSMGTRKTSTRKASPRKSGTLTASARKTAPSKAASKPAVKAETGKTPAQAASAEKTATAAMAAAEPVVVAPSAPVVSAPELSKKELVEFAVERSGVKKRDAKPVVEAVLALLGEAIAEGRDLNLKPFGKMRVNRSQERSNGTVFVCKLRRPLASEKASAENDGREQISSSEPLAEVSTDG